MRFSKPVRALLFALVTLVPATLGAQEDPSTPEALSHRPVASRAQLEEALKQAEALANSGAYSPEFRGDKRAEAALIRERLIEGDFYSGDQIQVTVTGDSASTGIKTVSPKRTLVLGGLPEIPLRGVLRSEIEPYLKDQLGRYIRDVEVKARPNIRLTIMGGVGKAGFYQMDADIMLADALTLAGNIGNNTDLKKSKITRDDEEIVDAKGFVAAINEGRTLDELNLRAGDVIEVGVKSTQNWLTTLRTIAIVPALVASSYGLGKLLGIF